MSNKDRSAGSRWLEDPANKTEIDSLRGQWIAAGEKGIIAHSRDLEDIFPEIDRYVEQGVGSRADVVIHQIPEEDGPPIPQRQR